MAIRIACLVIGLCGCFESSADAVMTVDAGPPPPAANGSEQSELGGIGDVAPAAGPTTADGACGNGVREGDELCDGADCPTTCAQTLCFHTELIGAAAACDARCVAEEITVCAAADGCCPQGCDHGADADCSPSCGDGVVTGAEKCEPDSVALPCATPNDCDDGDPCTEDKVIGSAPQCSAQCAHMPITKRAAGDRCCPAGTNVGEDPDCEAYCGDGVVSAGEQCDPAVRGSCPTHASCALLTKGCDRSVLVGSGCDAHCEPERIGTAQSGDQCCPSGATVGTDSDCDPRCGDGVVSANEECDPNTPAGDYGRCPASANDCSLPAGDACLEAVLTGDPQQCTARCTFEPRAAGPRDACCPSGASAQDDPDCAAVCGNGVLENGELCDDGPGSPRTCPTNDDCQQGAGCSGRRLSGSATTCTAQCERYEIVEAIAGDSCCPSTQTPSTDPDCSAAGSMYGQCTWISAYPPSYDPTTGSIEPKASAPYGCDGTYSVCTAQWCEPLCDPGDTKDPEGRPGRCVKAFPNAFEVFCEVDADCPADRECGTTNSSTVKTCLKGLRRS